MSKPNEDVECPKETECSSAEDARNQLEDDLASRKAEIRSIARIGETVTEANTGKAEPEALLGNTDTSCNRSPVSVTSRNDSQVKPQEEDGGHDVKKLYALGGAKWYDSLKRLLMNPTLASKAECELHNFLRDNLDENKTILELGCGTGENPETMLTRLQLKFKSYLGLDFSPDMLRIARKKFEGNPAVNFREGDITKLDGFDEKFDVIICTWVLSHIRDPADIVNKAQELLQANGHMFLMFFTRPKWYVNFWFLPLKNLFRMTYVSGDAIEKFRNVDEAHGSATGLTTTVRISKKVD